MCVSRAVRIMISSAIEIEEGVWYKNDMQLDGKLRSLIRQLVQDGIPLKEACNEFELKYIQEALKLHEGNISLTAEKLGVHRNTLYNRLKRLETGKHGV